MINVNDSFRTTNNFYGGTLGLTSTHYQNRWVYEGTAQVALGANCQKITINGSTMNSFPGQPTVVNPGGLLALSSNIGSYSHTNFMAIPQISRTVGLPAHATLDGFRRLHVHLLGPGSACGRAGQHDGQSQPAPAAATGRTRSAILYAPRSELLGARHHARRTVQFLILIARNSAVPVLPDRREKNGSSPDPGRHIHASKPSVEELDGPLDERMERRLVEVQERHIGERGETARTRSADRTAATGGADQRGIEQSGELLVPGARVGLLRRVMAGAARECGIDRGGVAARWNRSLPRLSRWWCPQPPGLGSRCRQRGRSQVLPRDILSLSVAETAVPTGGVTVAVFDNVARAATDRH